MEYCQGVPPKLTTTSYALLGLLNLQPFSAYELTKYMKRSALAQLWPRTETSLYKEPKVLEAHGFATADIASTGARARTVYSITPAGRRAFRKWLREPGGALVFECEAAMKAFFGDATDVKALRAQLEVLAAHPESSTAAARGPVGLPRGEDSIRRSRALHRDGGPDARRPSAVLAGESTDR
jgi:DNA-binding PadR family transcriptional regulator